MILKNCYNSFEFYFRETLSHSEVVTYVNSNMIFWACSITTSEGYRVSQALRENGYPFLALIVLHDSRMTVVGRMEGYFPAHELVDRLRYLLIHILTKLF